MYHELNSTFNLDPKLYDKTPRDGAISSPPQYILYNILHTCYTCSLDRGTILTPRAIFGRLDRRPPPPKGWGRWGFSAKSGYVHNSGNSFCHFEVPNM